MVAILLQGGRASEERVGREIGEALRGERSDPTSQVLRPVGTALQRYLVRTTGAGCAY